MSSKSSQKSKPSKLWLGVAVIVALVCSTFPHSDTYIRNRVVMLQQKDISCSGEQVRTRSGHDYVLSAAHCREMEEGGYITAITESGEKHKLKVIAEDPTSDLLLLEGLPNLKGLEIANIAPRFSHVRTFTHGEAKPTYITEGVIVGVEETKVLLGLIGSPEEKAKCEAQPFKFKIMKDPDFGFELCVLDVEEAVTTAGIVPGSSGGVVVNESGDVVGVASATGGGFGFLVTLIDIKAFLKDR